MENDKRQAGRTGLWNRMSGPVKVGLAFALIAVVLALVGLLKGTTTTPLSIRSVLLAILISGGTWGVVSWAIATAVVEVEEDVAQANSEIETTGSDDAC